MDGPTPNFSVPSASLVAVGIRSAGPAPQMTFPVFAGEKKSVIVVSPIPVIRVVVSVGCDCSGMMTRRMTFQSFVRPKGATG